MVHAGPYGTVGKWSDGLIRAPQKASVMTRVRRRTSGVPPTCSRLDRDLIESRPLPSPVRREPASPVRRGPARHTDLPAGTGRTPFHGGTRPRTVASGGRGGSCGSWSAERLTEDSAGSPMFHVKHGGVPSGTAARAARRADRAHFGLPHWATAPSDPSDPHDAMYGCPAPARRRVFSAAHPWPGDQEGAQLVQNRGRLEGMPIRRG
jgi:hypothetical protein